MHTKEHPKITDGTIVYAARFNDCKRVLTKSDNQRKKEADNYSMDGLLMPDIIKSVSNTRNFIHLRMIEAIIIWS